MARINASRALALAAVVGLLAGLPGQGQAQDFKVGRDFTTPSEERFVPGEVIVRFKDVPVGAASDLPGARAPQALSKDTCLYKLDVPMGGPATEGPAATAQMEQFLASMREREQWVLAYFVERSELFELDDPEYRPCSLCHGVGLLSKVLQTGQTMSYLCTQCAGAQQDKIVKYR